MAGKLHLVANAAVCPDPSNTDCPSLRSESQFVHLIDDTITYFSSSPIRTELVNQVQRALIGSLVMNVGGLAAFVLPTASTSPALP